MGKRKSIVAWFWAIIILLSMTGCKSEAEADIVKEPAETTVAETNTAALAEKKTGKSIVTVYVSAPGDWEEVYVWAWKDGGENAADYWYGMAYNDKDTYFREALPGWIDRVIIRNMADNTTTEELVLEPGYDVWIVINGQETTIHYEDPNIVVPRTKIKDPFYLAAEQKDFEAMKSMLADIEDRSILTDWVYNDFNYEYALDAIRAGDYETAVEFFGYCAYEDNQLYGKVIETLVAGEWEAALDILKSISYATLDQDLEMSWAEIIGKITGFAETLSDLDRILLDKYVTQYLRSYEPSFKEDQLLFGETSYWMSENYIGEITDSDYFPVANFNKLKSQCGREPKGKILILRSQMSYPKGTTYYAIDLLNMEHLSADLYPASLSEVEYILLVDYGYTVDGKYRQTFSVGDNSVTDDFAFLRMEGQVQLLNASSGQIVQSSPRIEGTGEVEAHFSELNYQCSNMPETGEYIISAVKRVRELNGD